MKNLIFLFALIFMNKANAQVHRKDTVKVDSVLMEKIKKMPMDSIKHPMPVVPVPEKDDPDKDAKKEQPIEL